MPSSARRLSMEFCDMRILHQDATTVERKLFRGDVEFGEAISNRLRGVRKNLAIIVVIFGGDYGGSLVQEIKRATFSERQSKALAGDGIEPDSVIDMT